MKKIILLLFCSINCQTFAQNDSLQKERYEVINALYKDFNNEKRGRITLDRNFFPFLGLGSLISDKELMETLIGTCRDFKTRKEYSYFELLNQEEILQMTNQISDFEEFRRIDPKWISDKIQIKKDPENIYTAITLPLVYNNKAVVYRTNKDSAETLFVLVKEKDEWKVTCIKYLYILFDH
ncbi:hypothetical protein [Salinimicrobium sp. GXAS 041]|uniref:hypothetical protein n=1 Tax=Salinimicrobium sp. GXAS 041 TaxID=3400806 RepID=UPI003C791DDE